jgi:hypothetical protein
MPYGVVGVGRRLRDICDRWSATVGHPVGLRTVNERINQLEPLVRQFHHKPFEQVPEVIQLDGIWVTITQQGEVVVHDRRDRARNARKGKKMVILVALGFWTENGKEKREIVDWQIAESEKHEEWEVLLHRIVKRGAKAENGLKAQYCEHKAKGGGRKDRKFQVWHNVRKKIKEGTFSCTDYGNWMSMTRYVNRSAQVY